MIECSVDINHVYLSCLDLYFPINKFPDIFETMFICWRTLYNKFIWEGKHDVNINTFITGIKNSLYNMKLLMIKLLTLILLKKISIISICILHFFEKLKILETLSLSNFNKINIFIIIKLQFRMSLHHKLLFFLIIAVKNKYKNIIFYLKKQSTFRLKLFYLEKKTYYKMATSIHITSILEVLKIF